MRDDTLISQLQSLLFSIRRPGWISATIFAFIGLAVSSSSAQTSQPAASASLKGLDRAGKTSEALQYDEALNTARQSRSGSTSAKSTEKTPLPKIYPNAARIESIQERINLLKKLIEEERIAAESTQPATPTATEESNTSRPDLQPDDDTESTPLNSGPTAELPVNQDVGGPEQPAANIQGTGIPVVGEPVNSFELANSLFLTGNVSAARKSYEARLIEDASVDDEAWLKCLVGCCYRLEGNFNKAEQMFRDVTNLKQNSYPVDYSKWCLQYVAKRRASLEQIQSIESEIDGMLQKAGKK